MQAGKGPVRGPDYQVMATTITENAEGKRVVHDGETVGMVTAVEHGTAMVEPDPGLSERIRAALGWADDEDAYPLQEAAVAETTDDEIRLRDGI